MVIEGGDYSLRVEGERLWFYTTAFQREAKSVLSPVVYGPELSALLAAAVPGGAAFLLFGDGLWRYAAMLGAYACGFLVFRLFVFKKRFLTLDMNKDTGVARIKKTFHAGKKFRTEEIEKVEAEHAVIVPQNQDGLRLVEEMALHHFTVLPGLDEPANFYVVRLFRKDRIDNGGYGIEIYSGRESRDAALIVDEMRKFLAQAH